MIAIFQEYCKSIEYNTTINVIMATIFVNCTSFIRKKTYLNIDWGTASCITI